MTLPSLINGTTMLDGRFLFLRELGRGVCGVVLLAMDTISKNRVAIKVVLPQLRLAGELEEALLIAAARRDPDHHVPIATLLLGPPIFLRKPSSQLTLSLMDQVRTKNCHLQPHIDIKRCRIMVSQVCAALAFLHGMNLIHADLKPENILWENDSNDRVKLVDFGNTLEANSIHDLMHDFDVQSMIYRAPEVAMGVSVTCAADMWSLGCILLECIVGRPIFTATTRMELLVQMQQLSKIPMDNALPNGIYTATFRERMLLPHISLSAIFDAYNLYALDRHLFSFLSELLQINPETRLTAKQAFFHPFLGPVFPFAHIFTSYSPGNTTTLNQTSNNDKRKHSSLKDALRMIQDGEKEFKFQRVKDEP